VVIAIVARVAGDEEVPAHEQWIAVGGALTNVLNALHMMGYGAKMLSGLRAADPKITQAFCKPGETLVGWISAGTPLSQPLARGSDDPASVTSRF
jgi:nitroreductase